MSSLLNLLRNIVRIPAWIAIGCIRLYQIFLSPWIGQSCRFTPTCSAYTIAAIRKYGAIRGIWKGSLRILRCHPWHPGGHDPP